VNADFGEKGPRTGNTHGWEARPSPIVIALSNAPIVAERSLGRLVIGRSGITIGEGHRGMARQVLEGAEELRRWQRMERGRNTTATRESLVASR